MSQSRQVRSAFGKVAIVLRAATTTHHRRRAVATESRGNAARVATIPQDHARLQLLLALEVRSEEGFLLPGDQRGPH